MLDSSLNKLENGKYYDVTIKRDDFKYKHLKLIEVQYREIESVLYFVNDDGRKISLYYDKILDISESKEKESKPYKYEIYFNGKQLYPDFKYDIYEELDGGISLIHRNAIIDGICYREEIEYLSILVNEDENNYIKIKNIKKIEYVE